MKFLLDPILNIVRFQKKKIFVAFSAFLFFLVTLFPFRDLGDFVTGRVAELTQNSVYIVFKDLGISLFPQPGIQMEGVTLDNPLFPTLTADSLFVSPSILGLITFRPGVKVDAGGLLGGNVHVVTRGGEATKAGPRKQHIDLALDGVNLKNLSQFLQSPIPLTGGLSSEIEMTIDPSFADQPEGALSINAQPLKWSGASVPTPMGAFPIPDLSFKSLQIDSELKKGRLTISKGQVGSSGDELVAKVTGSVEVKVAPGLQGVQLIPGGYDLNINLQVRSSLASKAGLLLNFIDAYRKPNADGSNQYVFRISAASTASQPHLSPAAP